MKKILERTIIDQPWALFELTAGDRLTLSISHKQGITSRSYHGKETPLYVFLPLSSHVLSTVLHHNRACLTPEVPGITHQDSLNMVIRTINFFTDKTLAEKFYSDARRSQSETVDIVANMDKAKQLILDIPCDFTPISASAS